MSERFDCCECKREPHEWVCIREESFHRYIKCPQHKAEDRCERCDRCAE